MLIQLFRSIKVDFEQKVFIMIYSCMRTSYKKGINIFVSHMFI